MKRGSKIIYQNDETDCGAACLSTVCEYYGKSVDLNSMRKLTKSSKHGVSMLNLYDAAHILGFEANGLSGEISDLVDSNVSVPCIAHIIVDKSLEHFVVIQSIDSDGLIIFDPNPSVGHKKYSYDEFNDCWTGHILSLVPNGSFKKSSVRGSALKRFFLKATGDKQVFLKIGAVSFMATGFNIAAIFVLYALLNLIRPGSSVTKIISTAICVIILYALEFLFNHFRIKLISYISGKLSEKMLSNYMNCILHSKFTYFDEHTSGDFISRLQDTEIVRDAITRITVTSMLDVIMTIICIIILVVSSYQLFFVAIATMGIYGAAIVILNRPISGLTEELRGADSSLTTQVNETLNGIETIKSYSKEDNLFCKNKRRIVNYAKILKRLIYIASEQGVLSNTISSIGEVVVLSVGTILIHYDSITYASLFVFYALYSMCLTPIKNLLDLIPIAQKAEISAQRIEETFDYPLERESTEETVSLSNKEIKLEAVSFCYDNGSKVFDNFSAAIPFGSKVYITGKNGSGKSTIAKLILDFYEPDSGRVTIGGISVGAIPIKQLRKIVSYAPQNPFIFRGSIIDNIMFGGIEQEKDCVISYIAKTPLNSIFSNLANGYESIVSEGGGNLSGGQRQAISIARTLLRKADIIILDEATSAIDEITAGEVMDYIMEENKGKTIISISHQTAQKKKFSTIIDLEKS